MLFCHYLTHILNLYTTGDHDVCQLCNNKKRFDYYVCQMEN